MSRYFRGGEADLEVFASYTSGNLAVLVAIERQHGEVGDLPDQDLSLRVTLVFRKRAGAVAISCIAMPTPWSANWDKTSCRPSPEATSNAGSARARPEYDLGVGRKRLLSPRPDHYACTEHQFRQTGAHRCLPREKAS